MSTLRLAGILFAGLVLMGIIMALSSETVYAQPVVAPGQRWVVLPTDSKDDVNLIDSLKTKESVLLDYYTLKPNTKFCVVYAGKDVVLSKTGKAVEQCVISNASNRVTVRLPVTGDGLLIVSTITADDEVTSKSLDLFKMRKAKY